MTRHAWLLVLAVAACGGDPVTTGDDAGADPDPLDLTSTAVPGSLDDLHERVIARRCSGQPGLCHNGQFEPNLSTPALTYAYVVNRPGIEKPDQLRVEPGNAASSLLVDKLRNRNGVATQMPLGAEPLAEEDIRAIEAWIDGGALRAPDADPAPALNNPPRRPEIGFFDTAGTRLDGTGPVRVGVGSTLILRHTVQDYETADAAIPFAAVILSIGDGRNVVLTNAANDPQLGPTTFDAAGPLGRGDRLNWRFSWTIPATLPLIQPSTGARTTIAASGQTITVLAVYVDAATPPIVALDVSATPIQIQ